MGTANNFALRFYGWRKRLDDRGFLGIRRDPFQSWFEVSYEREKRRDIKCKLYDMI